MKILTRVNINGLCRQKTIDVKKLDFPLLFNQMDALRVKEMMIIIPRKRQEVCKQRIQRINPKYG